MYLFDQLYSMFFVMSEWLLFNAKWAIFQIYNGENKLYFNEIMIMSPLY